MHYFELLKRQEVLPLELVVNRVRRGRSDLAAALPKGFHIRGKLLVLRCSESKAEEEACPIANRSQSVAFHTCCIGQAAGVCSTQEVIHA